MPSVGVALRRAWRLSWSRKVLALEAIVRLSSAWLCIRLLPYVLWKPVLGQSLQLERDSLSGDSQPPETQGALLAEVAWVHERLARAARGAFTCLMIALSARGMLALRGVTSILVLGVRKGGPRDRGVAPGLGAHAWLLCGRVIVVGGQEEPGHVPVAAFRRHVGARAHIGRS